MTPQSVLSHREMSFRSSEVTHPDAKSAWKFPVSPTDSDHPRRGPHVMLHDHCRNNVNCECASDEKPDIDRRDPHTRHGNDCPLSLPTRSNSRGTARMPSGTPRHGRLTPGTTYGRHQHPHRSSSLDWHQATSKHPAFDGPPRQPLRNLPGTGVSSRSPDSTPALGSPEPVRRSTAAPAPSTRNGPPLCCTNDLCDRGLLSSGTAASTGRKSHGRG